MIKSSLTSLKVLYVEDDPSIQEAFARFLRRRVGTLEVASDGSEGLKLASQNSYDLIITDIRMPKMDGLEMIEAIRKSGNDVPIVITTAFNEEEYFLRAIDLGVEKFLKKPVDSTLLVETLNKHAKLALQQYEIETKNRLISLILENITELMMVVKDEQIEYLNKAFLEFAGEPDVESFRVRDVFFKMLDCEEEISSYKDLAEAVVASTEKDRMVSIISPNSGESHSFIIKVNFPDSNSILFTFIDVTSIEKERAWIEKIATTDTLTKIFNRRKFDEEFDKEIERVKRYNSHALSLIMFDIDRFKVVNDTFGHLRGDEVLKDISKVVQENIRKGDIFARYGGEEFVVLLPENSLQSAVSLANKLRVAIENYSFEEVGKVTCSFGVAELRKDEHKESLIQRADQALYSAKDAGRNCVKSG